MADFEHIITRSNGPDSYMIGLGDLLVQQDGGQLRVYAASGMGGGASLRTGDQLDLSDRAEYAQAEGLSAPRQLHLTQIDGVDMLLAPGQYGREIDAWVVNSDGSMGAARPLTLSGGDAGVSRGAITAMEEMYLGGRHVFVTASRYANGLEVWARDGTTLRSVGDSDSAGFLDGGTVQAMALTTTADGPLVLAASSADDDLLAFRVLADGSLGAPARLDLRDGLYIDTPTYIETAEVGGKTFAILGSSGSSSVSVIEVLADGQMRVTHQINDTAETYFAGAAALEVLETPAGVFVLTTGTDNGLSLMILNSDGMLVHLGSVGDEMREMALTDTAGLEMLWRDGGLDIFVSGEVLEGDNAGGRGLTQLRVDDLEDSLPQVQTGNASDVYTGTAGVDLFRVSQTGADQVIRDYDSDMDQLDLSGMGGFYDVADLDISRTSSGAVIRLGDAQVTIFTDDGSPLRAGDFTTADVRDLWHVDIAPMAALTNIVDASLVSSVGGTGSDLLDGRAGADILLGQPQDVDFDACAAQVFRLYQATLARAPDQRGLMNWSQRLESGELSLLEVVSGFTNSAEFTQTYGDTSNRGFVSLLYDNVLGRAPDAAGLANWSGRLDRGEMSRAQVVQGFSESPEFRTATTANALAFSRAGLQADFSDDIYRVYRATLDRDPDVSGFTNWSGRMADGMPFLTAVSGFTNSTEFIQTYGDTSNRAFVTLLYNNVLDRAPDATGLENWRGRLDSGALNREQVVQGFAQSDEFITATMPDLKRWVLAQGIDDILDGGGGMNVLMGGLLSDMFVFRASEDGTHVVVDTEPWDVLRLEGFGYEQAADLAAHLSMDGPDVIFADEDVSIRFLNTDIASILDAGLEF